MDDAMANGQMWWYLLALRIHMQIQGGRRSPPKPQRCVLPHSDGNAIDAEAMSEWAVISTVYLVRGRVMQS